MQTREQRAMEIADDVLTGFSELDPYDQLERIAAAILRAMDEERERALEEAACKADYLANWPAHAGLAGAIRALKREA